MIGRYRQVRSLCSTAGIEKWLLYFDLSLFRNTFNITLTNALGIAACVGRGEWETTAKGGHRISITGFGKRTELLADHRGRPPLRSKKETGLQTLTGFWKIDGIEVGSCTLVDARMTGVKDPILDLVSDPLGCRIQIFRSYLHVGCCPLTVEGFDGYEMVLEDYSELSRAERAYLPKAPRKRGYVGSLRAMRYIAPESKPKLEVVGLITAIARLVIRQDSGAS